MSEQVTQREYVEKRPGYWQLDLECIVMAVVRSADGAGRPAFLVQSSHGCPEGSYGTLESAQDYGKRFAGMLLEETLAGLSKLEAQPVPATVGYKPKPCVLLLLQVEAPPAFLEDGRTPNPEHAKWVLDDGSVNYEYAESQKHLVIGRERTRMRALLAAIGR